MCIVSISYVLYSLIIIIILIIIKLLTKEKSGPNDKYGIGQTSV